jgi:hypothetical protein
LSEAFGGKSGAVGDTGPFSERTVVLSASEATIAGREPSSVGSETTQTHSPKSALARDAPVYNLLARVSDGQEVCRLSTFASYDLPRRSRDGRLE